MGNVISRIIPQSQDTGFIVPVIKQPAVLSPIPFLQQDSGSPRRKREKKKKVALKKEQAQAAKQVPEKDTLQQATADTVQKSSGPLTADTLALKTAPDKFQATSLFKNHLLQADSDLELKLNIRNHQYWIPAILLFTIAVYAFARIRYSKRVDQILGAFSIGSGGFNRRSREENVLFTRASILLMGLSVFVLSLFIFHVVTHYALPLQHGNKIMLFLKMMLLIVLIYLAKGVMIKTVGFIFQVENESKEYLIHIFLFNELLGMLLLPVVIALNYVKLIPPQYLINTGIVMIGFILIYRTVKVILLSVSYSKISKFYFFLYLCTLEILPLIVLAKLLNIKISL